VARILHVVYRDSSRADIPVDPAFKLKVNRRGIIPITLRDGSRAIIPASAVGLATVEETLAEEDR
jgi:hypothetical protein